MCRCAAMPFPYNPFCENGVQESPQTFLNPEIINNDSADNIQSAAEDISNRFALSLNASCLCDPCCENGVQESPQTFLNPEI